jgi:hypothetical protein
MARSGDSDGSSVSEKTLGDLLNIPDDILPVLTNSDMKLDRLLKNMSGGIALRTHFSGYETPGITLQWCPPLPLSAPDPSSQREAFWVLEFRRGTA